MDLSRTHLSLLTLAAIATTMASACADPAAHRPQEGNPRQVLMLMLDAANPDRFSSYGYPRETTPNIDRLADRSALFTRHFAQGTFTRVALPPMLYSRYFITPFRFMHGDVPRVYPQDLFRIPDSQSISWPRLLSQAGFRTHLLSAHTGISEGTGFAREFDSLKDLTVGLNTPGHPYPKAETVIAEALDWLERHQNESFFLYVHLMDIHAPLYFEEDAQHFFGASQYDARRFGLDGRVKDLEQPLEGKDREYLDALYDGSLRYTDRHIGTLLDSLERQGRLDDMLIVVTGDHGEHLLETPGRFGHSGPWFDRVAHIPLLLFYPPRIEAQRFESFTESVDLMPTLLPLLDVPLPEDKQVDGVNLFSPAATDERPFVFARQAVRSPKAKVLFDTSDDELLASEPPTLDQISGFLYDLETDPKERHNVWSERPETVQSLLEAYRQRLQGPYRRYARATTSAQPPEAFAIRAYSWQLTPEAPVVSDMPGSEAPDHVVRRSRLLTRGGAGPIQVEFPLPDGEYNVIGEIRGHFRVRLGDQPEVEIAQPRTFEKLPIGSVVVDQQRFRATLTPGAEAGPVDGWHAFTYLLFEPLGGGVQELTEERIQRLKALGYLN